MGAVVNGLSLSKVRGVRLRLPDLQRLRPARHPPERDHGDPDHPRLHPRLDRRRRGWTHPPADRAAALAPGHPRPDHHSPGRRERGGRGLAGHHEAAAPAGGPGPLPPGAPDLRPKPLRRRTWRREGRLRPGRRRGREAGRDPARERERGVALRRGVRAAHGGGHPGPGGEHAVVGAVRAAGPEPTATASFRPR